MRKNSIFNKKNENSFICITVVHHKNMCWNLFVSEQRQQQPQKMNSEVRISDERRQRF